MRGSRSAGAGALAGLIFLFGSPAITAAIDFAAAKSYPVGTTPAATVVVDFNGDGKPDIAVANTGSNNVSILLGNGDGTFQSAVNYNTGNNPSAIAVGDFNGDGKLDLALFQPGNTQSSPSVAGSVSILLGNGDGTFQAPKTTALTTSTVAMAVADFNLDKKSDLALTSATGNGVIVSILLSNGDGTFQSPQQTSLTNTSNVAFSTLFASADFNGDSKPDIAVATSTGFQILLGKGDGTFVQGAMLAVNGAPRMVLTADLNHDGKVDLLVTSRFGFCFGRFQCNLGSKLSVFLGKGDGTFQSEQVVASANIFRGGSTIGGALVGDFNGDGKPDVAYQIASSASPPALDIRLGRGDGTFSPVVLGLPGTFVAAQDLNADKLSDLVGLGTSNDISVLLNNSPTSGADLDIHDFSGASPEPVGVLMNLTYKADVVNQGPQDATGVTFTDTLPSSVNFVSASSTQGSCTQANGVVSCNIGSLASAFDATITIVVTPTVVGTITNSMSVAANEPDLVVANNTATQTSTVVPVFTLTVTKTGNGSGTVGSSDGVINCGSTCTAMYLSGTVVTLNENPDAGSLFSNWSGDCTGNGVCSITMNANKSVAANFVLGETLTVVVAGSGTGTVTTSDGAINCSGSTCSSLYLPGTAVSLTATPSGNSVFGGWSGACMGSDPKVCSVTLNSNQSVTATFNPPPDFTIAAQPSSLSTQTGMQVTDVLTLTGTNGFSGNVNLSCTVSGPAPQATCKVSSSPVALGASPVTSTLTITAPATLSVLAVPRPDGGARALFAVTLPIPGLLFGLLHSNRRKTSKRRSLWLLGSSVLALFVLFGGCGGSAPPAPENFIVTVTATSGPLQHATTVSLTVQ